MRPRVRGTQSKRQRPLHPWPLPPRPRPFSGAADTERGFVALRVGGGRKRSISGGDIRDY